jgi:uncharacterized protein
MTSAALPIGHIEIPVHDLNVATKFYRTAFYWNIDDHAHDSEGKSCLFNAGDVAGALTTKGTPSDKGVLLYIRAIDMVATLDMIRRSGGTVLSEKTAIPGGRGYLSYFLDPSGNRLGLWSET